MSKKIAVIISPNWKDYAKKYLIDLINSLENQSLKDFKTFFIDNETSEDSYRYLKKNIENKINNYSIIRNKNNDGFSKGNNDAIKQALKEEFEYIILFNLDGIIEKNCLEELIKKAETDEKIGAVQARIMLYPQTKKVNSLGNTTHFLGFGYCLGYNREYNSLESIENICYPSGAAVLFKAAVLKTIGLFDEEFWMYNEDQDLGWRVWLAGFKCVLATKAIFYHKYEFNRSVKKYYWMDRNRLIVILKNYSLLTLLFILPALIIMEFGLLLFSIMNNSLKEKIAVYKYFFNIKNWQYILKARKSSQTLRKINDRHIVRMFSGNIAYQEIDSLPLKIGNILFTIYWRIIKIFII